MGNRFFPNPYIFIDFSITNGQTTIGIDRSWQCGHLGLCIFWGTFWSWSTQNRKHLSSLLECALSQASGAKWMQSEVGHIARLSLAFLHNPLKGNIGTINIF